MNPSFKDQLNQWKKENIPAPTPSKDIEKKAVKKQQKPEKEKEKLSDSDLNYLMGCSRPRMYRARGGAFRQR